MMVRTSIALFLSSLSCEAAPSLNTIKQSLVRWEGYRLTPYRDPVSKDWCVGVGHNLTARRQAIRGSYTALEVEKMLLHDISEAIDAARAAVRGYDELPDEVQLVVVHLAFSCGRSGLLRFINLRRALGWRAYNSAATELRLSRWYSQVSPSRAAWAHDILYRQP